MSTQTTEVTRRVCDYLDYSGSLSLNPLVSQISVQHQEDRCVWYITIWHAPTGHAFNASFTEAGVMTDGIASCVHEAMKRIEKRFLDYHEQYIDRFIKSGQKVGAR